MAWRSRRSTLGMRRSASARVNRFGMPGASNAGHLNRHRTAARSVEFGENDALPGAQQDRGISDLQGEALSHDHAAQMRIGVLALAIGVPGIIVTPGIFAGDEIIEEVSDVRSE